MAESKEDKLTVKDTVIIEAEILPPKAEEVEPKKLTLARTKRLAKQILELGTEEVHKLLEDQINMKLLFLNDRILAELELLENTTDWKERTSIAMVIEGLQRTATAITNAKHQLDHALGKDLYSQLPQNAPTIGEPEGEISAEEFEREYLKQAAKSGTALVKPAKV